MPPSRNPKATSGKPYRRGDALSQLGKPSSTKKAKSTPRQRPTAPPVEADSENTPEEEAEWTGIASSEAEEETAEESGKLVRKGGKKGKKFVESQDELLSLIHSITGEKESLQKTKLSKVKRPPPLAIVAKKKFDKVAAKKLEFESAKAVISAQTRAKKDRRTAREETRKTKEKVVDSEENDMEDGAEPLMRKRVSFA